MTPLLELLTVSSAAVQLYNLQRNTKFNYN